jgi:hypothetical protein
MLNHTDTKAALVAGLQIMAIAIEYISANPAGMSSSELYMRMAEPLKWQDDSEYQRMLTLLLGTKLVKRTGHWLTVEAR